MARSEDREEILLRRLRERRTALIESVSRGKVSAENVAGGYLYIAGGIVELDAAIALVEELLFHRGVPEPVSSGKPFDPYGVR